MRRSAPKNFAAPVNDQDILEASFEGQLRTLIVDFCRFLTQDFSNTEKTLGIYL